jgi:Flp pilus assembly protein TadG
MHSGKKYLRRLVTREDGVVAVEMVLLFPLLVLIVVGIVEFGHMWDVRQTLTNASREGARAAVVYAVDPATNAMVDSGTRTNWATTAVTNYLTGKNISGTNTTVAFPDGDVTGGRVEVTVTSPSGLILLQKLLPAFNNITLSAETTMRLE